MTLQQFELMIETAHHLETEANSIRRRAETLEALALKLAGIQHVDRDPGFPCWKIAGQNGYFNTPYQAAQAGLK